MTTPNKIYTLNDITCFCNEFKRTHLIWPTHKSTAKEFLEAGIHGVNGRELNVMLENGACGLKADPAYRKLFSLAMKCGPYGPDLSFLNPDVIRTMPADHVERLIDSITISLVHEKPRPQDMLWFRIPVEMRNQACAAAGIDPRALAAKSVSVVTSVPLTPELVDNIGNLRMIYGNSLATCCDKYYAELLENNRIYFRYTTILGFRFVADVTPEMKDRLQGRLSAQVLLAVEEAQRGAIRDVEANVKKAVGTARATTLKEQLTTLRASVGIIHLPNGFLSRYNEIKALLEKAGGRYVSNKKTFAFDAGIDCQQVLADLVVGKDVNFKKQYQFFATQPDEARQLCVAAGPLDGKRVLEPHAGDGALADVARAMGATVVAVELWNVNAIKLREKGYEPIERDFLSLTPAEIGYFDAIIANPPFTKNQDIQHVAHMLNFLKPGGSLSVIMSTGWRESPQKAHVQFRDFLATQDFSISTIAAGAFDESGTGVATVRVDIANYQPHPADDMEEQEGDAEVPELA